MAIIQPSLRDFGNAEFYPQLKLRAIAGMSRRDKAAAQIFRPRR